MGHIGFVNSRMLLAYRRKTSQILADHRTQLIERHITDDHGLEVSSIAEPILINLKDTIVVDFSQTFLRHRLQTRMVSIKDGSNRVVIIHTWRCISIIQERVATVIKASESCRITTRLGKIEVSQLHHGLCILDRGATTDALRLAAHGSLHSHTLISQFLTQCNSIPRTNAALTHSTRDQ